MPLLFWVTAMLAVGLSVAVVACCWVWHRRLTPDTVRMASMTLGMVGGVAFGVGTAVLTADPFRATVYGSGMGMAAGFFPALFARHMVALDGLLSGLMGGMMGAMTGDMMPTDRADALLKIAFSLFACVTVLTLCALVEEARPGRHPAAGRPLLVASLLLVGLLGYLRLGPLYPVTAHETGTEPVRVAVVANEFGFLPHTLTLPAGQPVTLYLVNRGAEEHDLHVANLRVKAYTVGERHSPGMAHRHGRSHGLHVHARPGETVAVTFIPLQPGIYPFACTVPGHADKGMSGTLIVR